MVEGGQGRRFGPIFLQVLVFFVIAIVGLIIYMPGASKRHAIDEQVKATLDIAARYKALRRYYTEKVISKIAKHPDFTIAADHEGKSNTLPLPATMIADLSQVFKKAGISFSLYSPYPFPGREDRVLDAFQREAWRVLVQHPNQVHYQLAKKGEKTFLRVAIADHMSTPACVSCHNSHPDTPKKDWKLGDVRGVLEVTSVLDARLARDSSLMLQFVIMLVVLLGLTGLLFFIHLRRARVEVHTDFLATHDPLTELANRNMLHSYFDAISETATRRQMKMALLFVDIDGFKPVNDQYGHRVGDQLLQGVGTRLRRRTRSSDLIARLGGDEFLLLFTNIEGRPSAERIAEQLVESVSQPFSLGEVEVSVSCSIGVALYPDHGTTLDELSERADAAMYSVKKHGKNSFAVANTNSA